MSIIVEESGVISFRWRCLQDLPIYLLSRIVHKPSVSKICSDFES
jgi:hypothetical protein